MKARISFFDWSGNLDEEIKLDEERFNIHFEEKSERCMGFVTFEVDGDESDIERFLSHYELELDEEEEAQ